MVSNMQVTMPDLNTSSVPVKSQKGVSYKKAKSDYKKMEKQIANSGFANSQTALEQELECLANLRTKLSLEVHKNACKHPDAIHRKMAIEGEWLQERELNIRNILAYYNSIFDYTPLVKGNDGSQGTECDISKRLKEYTDDTRQTAYDCMLALAKKPGESLTSTETMNIVRNYSKEENGQLTISEKDLNFIKTLIKDYDLVAEQIDDLSEIKNEEDRQFICEYIDKFCLLQSKVLPIENAIDPEHMYKHYIRPLIMFRNNQPDNEKPKKIDKEYLKRVYDDFNTIKSDLPSNDLNFRVINHKLDKNYMNFLNLILNGGIYNIIHVIKYDMENREETIKSLHKLIKNLGWTVNTSHDHRGNIAEFPYYLGLIIEKKLVVKDENNKISVSDKSVDYVCKLKETLEATRNNEEKERKSPIFRNYVEDVIALEERRLHNLYNADSELQKQPRIIDMMHSFDKQRQIEFLTKFTGIKDKEKIENIIESIYTAPSAKELYDWAVVKKEGQIISDFVDEFKDSKGEIDSKYARIIIQLRQAGITYDSLIELTKSCINKDGSINASKLKAICDLKKAGAISKDIQEITDACEKDKDGNILESDLNICRSLTSANIEASKLTQLLPYVKKDKELIDIAKNYNPYSNELFQIPRVNDGKYDETTLNLLKTILKNQKINTENELEYDDDFIAKVMRLSKDENGKVSEEASDICTSMIKNQERPEDILTALEICSDGEGHFDKNLTDLLWLLSEDETYFGLTEKLIKSCRNENGEIDNKKAEYMERLLKAGESPLNLVKINI